MIKVYIMHKLKKGATMEDYKEFSPQDQETARSHPKVKSFRIYQIKGGEGDEIPFDLVEELEVENWEVFHELGKDSNIAKMERIWLDKYVGNDSLVTFYGEII